MKGLIAFVVTSTVFLTGCFGGTGPAPRKSPLDEATFVKLSADVLCLPQSAPDATTAEIDELAAQLAGDLDISETEYNTYRKQLGVDEERVRGLILKLVAEQCPVTTDESTDTTGESTEDTVETPADAANTDTTPATETPPTTDTPVETPATTVAPTTPAAATEAPVETPADAANTDTTPATETPATTVAPTTPAAATEAPVK